MKELDSRVNIIPVIAKADTVSRPDLIQFKKQVCFVINLILQMISQLTDFKCMLFINLITVNGGTRQQWD